MKSPYTCLYREIWNEEKFWMMSESAQLVYVHLLSTPLGNGIGCYKAGLEALADDKRMESKAYREAFAEAFAKGFVEYDEKHRVIWIPKYIQRNEPGNPNVLKSWYRIHAVLPGCDLKDKCYQAIKAFAEGKSEAFAKAFAEAFAKALPKDSGNMALSPSLYPDLGDQGYARPPICKVHKEEFEAFRKAWPKDRWVGELRAQEAWDKMATEKDRPPLPVILAALEAQKRSQRWEEPRFIPNPEKWILGACWNDAIIKGSGTHTVGRPQPKEVLTAPEPPPTPEEVVETKKIIADFWEKHPKGKPPDEEEAAG